MKIESRLRLRHIRCFLEVARAASLDEAASQLNITQPAVSKTLKELEETLGVVLFDRSARRIRLNEAGRVFQQHAGTAMAELTKAQNAVRNVQGDMVKLSIGVLPTAATDLLPRAAIRFKADYANSVIHVITGPNWLLLSQLREGQLDLVVGRMASAEQMTGLTFEQLYVEDIMLVARPDHPLLRADSGAELSQFPMIMPPKGAVISTTVRGYLQSIGLHAVRPMFETVSLAFGRRAVQLSDAVWFISRGVVADELAQGTLRVIDVHHPLLAGPVGVSLREDALRRPEIVALLDQLRVAARQLRASPPDIGSNSVLSAE
jgi:LysR family pca operon transcriptional activator